jgi:hypothetical protein
LPFVNRRATQSKGGETTTRPTHPSDQNRIAELKNLFSLPLYMEVKINFWSSFSLDPLGTKRKAGAHIKEGIKGQNQDPNIEKVFS